MCVCSCGCLCVLATKIGGIVRGVFTDTIIFEGEINKPKCNKDVIGGIRETAIKDFTKCINTTPINLLISCKSLDVRGKIMGFKASDLCFVNTT
jgi:hypothetical protein